MFKILEVKGFLCIELGIQFPLIRCAQSTLIYDLVTMVQSEIAVWAKAQYIMLPSRFKRKELRNILYKEHIFSFFFGGKITYSLLLLFFEYRITHTHILFSFPDFDICFLRRNDEFVGSREGERRGPRCSTNLGLRVAISI